MNRVLLENIDQASCLGFVRFEYAVLFWFCRGCVNRIDTECFIQSLCYLHNDRQDLRFNVLIQRREYEVFAFGEVRMMGRFNYGGQVRSNHIPSRL